MKSCRSLRPQGCKLVCSELQLRALGLRTCELHDVGQRRQNLGRFLRRRWPNQRLSRMRRMQRLGKNRLPRMESISAASGQRLRGVSSRSGFWRANGRKNGRKIFRRIIPSDLGPGRRGNGVRRVNIPDRRGEENQEDLQHGRDSEGVLRESLLDPAILKVQVAGKFLWRRRPVNHRDQTGGKLPESARFFEHQSRNRQLGRRVERSN